MLLQIRRIYVSRLICRSSAVGKAYRHILENIFDGIAIHGIPTTTNIAYMIDNITNLGIHYFIAYKVMPRPPPHTHTYTFQTQPIYQLIHRSINIISSFHIKFLKHSNSFINFKLLNIIFDISLFMLFLSIHTYMS